METVCRKYIADQVEVHPMVISSKALLPVNGTNRVFITLSPPEIEYAILDPEKIRRCKFTVRGFKSSIHCSVLDEERSMDEPSSVFMW